MRTVGISLLERERRRHGLTATELAKLIDLSRVRVSQVETGAQEPSPAFMHRAADALGVRVESLWPSYYFATVRRPDGLLLVGHEGCPAVLTDEEAARDFAEGIGASFAGPAPPAVFAVALGLSEDEVPARLIVDPHPETAEGDGP